MVAAAAVVVARLAAATRARATLRFRGRARVRRRGLREGFRAMITMLANVRVVLLHAIVRARIRLIGAGFVTGPMLMVRIALSIAIVLLVRTTMAGG